MSPHLFMLIGMVVIHLFGMLPLMTYHMSDYYLSLNQFYMALWMGLAMVILEAFMHPMPKWAWMATIIGLVIVGYAIRKQLGVNWRQYIRDMIPHHSMALLTSTQLLDKQANNIPANVKTLAENILDTQKLEIHEMKTILQTT